jgi:hypothetical protein
VVAPAADRPDPQPDQPGVERREAHRRVAGRERVVAEDLLGHPDVAEEVPEDRLGGDVGHLGAGDQGQEVGRVVVDDRERDAAAAAHLQRALEVELPELVGLGPLEPLGRSPDLITNSSRRG